MIRGGTEVSVPGRARKREGEIRVWDRSLSECLNEGAKMGAGEIRAGTARSRGPAARFARGSEGAGQPPALAAQARCFARGSEGVAARAAATGSEKALHRHRGKQVLGKPRRWCASGRRRGSGGKVKPAVASMTQHRGEPFGEDRTNWRDLVTVGFWNGERGRNRTCNLLIKSQLLCQLSYAPTCGGSFSV